MTAEIGLTLDGAGPDADDIKAAIALLKNPNFKRSEREVSRLTAMQDFRSGVIRFLARHAGKAFKEKHDEVLAGTAPAVLDEGAGRPLLKAIKKFAQSSLYSSRTVPRSGTHGPRSPRWSLRRLQTAMNCEKDRFDRALDGDTRDETDNRSRARAASQDVFHAEYSETYKEAVSLDNASSMDKGSRKVMERIRRASD